MRYEPVYTEEGQYLGTSRKVPGAVSGNAYDASGLAGPVAWRPVLDDDEDKDQEEDAPDLSATVLGIAIGAVGTVIAIAAAPHVKSGWNVIKAKWARRSGTSETDHQAAGMAALSGTAPADFSTEVAAALEDHSTSMSSAEAQQRLLALLRAAAFIADQMRTLSNARIEDDPTSRELASAMQKLTTPQIADSINRMLAADASLLDDETSADLMRIFGGGQTVDGQYVPLRPGKIKDALRLH